MILTDAAILDYIAAHPGAGRSDIRRDVAPEMSAPTVWRALKRLAQAGRTIAGYAASAENYRVLRAEAETPDKATLAYRDFVRAAVRRSILEFGAFRREALVEMAVVAGVPESDRDALIAYIARELTGLHEGNVIRYRLRAEDLIRLDRSTLPA